MRAIQILTSFFWNHYCNGKLDAEGAICEKGLNLWTIEMKYQFQVYARWESKGSYFLDTRAEPYYALLAWFADLIILSFFGLYELEISEETNDQKILVS